VLAVYVLMQAPAFAGIYSHLFEMRPPNFADESFAALEHLPPHSNGKKIYHCEWETGSYILYARPDMRFVDLLDPHFLLEADPKKEALRIAMNFGTSAEGSLDVYAAIHGTFGAQYVLCSNQRVVDLLSKDPRFVKLYSGNQNLFEVQSISETN
jgi:hypothetical protein